MCHWHCGAGPSTNYVVSAHTVLLHIELELCVSSHTLKS